MNDELIVEELALIPLEMLAKRCVDAQLRERATSELADTLLARLSTAEGLLKRWACVVPAPWRAVAVLIEETNDLFKEEL